MSPFLSLLFGMFFSFPEGWQDFRLTELQLTIFYWQQKMQTYTNNAKQFIQKAFSSSFVVLQTFGAESKMAFFHFPLDWDFASEELFISTTFGLEPMRSRMERFQSP